MAQAGDRSQSAVQRRRIHSPRFAGRDRHAARRPRKCAQFTADTSPDKRARLVDRLLERNEYASLLGACSGAICCGTSARGRLRSGAPSPLPLGSTKPLPPTCLTTSLPPTILTAQGNVTDNPPVVWYRHVRNVVHQVNDTSQVFMGTRINCANCHHHPYERWSQEDYWGMAAFFARLGIKPAKCPTRTRSSFAKRAANQPRTGKVMKPKALGGPEYRIRARRRSAAVVGQLAGRARQPLFRSRRLCNRMWAHFMGVGLVEAVDDMRVTNPPSNPELLETLSRDFIAHKFDLKHLIRQIMTSEVYALSSVPTELNSKDRRNYARYFPKRMPRRSAVRRDRQR